MLHCLISWFTLTSLPCSHHWLRRLIPRFRIHLRTPIHRFPLRLYHHFPGRLLPHPTQFPKAVNIRARNAPDNTRFAVVRSIVAHRSNTPSPESELERHYTDRVQGA